MKKILLSLSLLAIAGSAMAQHHHHGYGHNHGYYRGPGYGWWVAPIVTGVIGYEIARQQQVIVQQPVIVQNPPVQVQGQTCTPWTETQNSDGTITRTRTCQ
jgi:hypothetical protein